MHIHPHSSIAAPAKVVGRGTLEGETNRLDELLSLLGDEIDGLREDLAPVLQEAITDAAEGSGATERLAYPSAIDRLDLLADAASRRLAHVRYIRESLRLK